MLCMMYIYVDYHTKFENFHAVLWIHFGNVSIQKLDKVGKVFFDLTLQISITLSFVVLRKCIYQILSKGSFEFFFEKYLDGKQQTSH